MYLATEVNGDNIAKAKRMIIETGKTQGDYVEVLQGIVAGEHVIKEGARSVREDQEIRIIE